jgi:ATP-dependent protease ClpP protease subunit
MRRSCSCTTRSAGGGTLAEDFIAELKQVTAPKLRVRVSSPGGNVFEGVALANALRAHPADVTVQVDGIAASIASVIAMAGDRVVIQPQAMIMVHEAAGAAWERQGHAGHGGPARQDL